MSESRAADGIRHVVVLSLQRLLAPLLECHPARLMRDPCCYNQSLSRAGPTRRPLTMKRSCHANVKQREPNRRYATDTMESAFPMRRHVLLWDGGCDF